MILEMEQMADAHRKKISGEQYRPTGEAIPAIALHVNSGIRKRSAFQFRRCAIDAQRVPEVARGHARKQVMFDVAEHSKVILFLTRLRRVRAM